MRVDAPLLAMAAALTCSLCAMGASAFAASVTPRYKDHPAAVYGGPRAPDLRLDGVPRVAPIDALQDALRGEPPNFAGRYVVMPFPAGTGCDSGAMVDLETGQAQMLPMASCGWAENGYAAPFEFNLQSRLFVVAGRIGEVGEVGAHFYVFNGETFTYLVSKLRSGELLETRGGAPETDAAAGIEPAAGEPAPPWPKLWDATARKPVEFILACYGLTTDAMAGKLAEALGERFEASFVNDGGYGETAKIAFRVCDGNIRSLGYFDQPQAYQDAKELFMVMAAEMDKKMLLNCLSEECKAIARDVFKQP